MADLGNLQFSVSLKDMTDADIKKIKDKLEKAGFKINASADRKSLEKNINDILRNRTFKINVEPNKKIKKAAIEVNKSLLVNSVTSALKGKTFKANVDVVVKTASVQDAIKQAFAKAGMNYNTTASDVRAQRILEIQQRMALRAAQANNNLNRSYREASIGASQFARATVGLNNGLQSNIRFGGKLGTVLGNLASILSSTNILKDVIRIGGELENQRIALGAILQDGGKATDMFSKIQSLAVKSPFGIMDLNQYVKQLAAYSVPYNELYETMKRLADVSAGVGVDMGRIILAFGQVKAAGFLKGTELRQFTEANIPMVDKLAERFTNLTGKIVGAAEVYDMISKKKVTFEDVKAVLWDLTDEGGMFNNMQEVLSESLASKWKNLADAIDVMYGKISDGWVGDALKGVAGLLTDITKGWEYVGTAITSATVAFLAHKAAVLLGTKQMSNARSVYASIMSGKQQEAAMLRQEQYYRDLTKAEQAKIETSGKLTKADVKKAVATRQLRKTEALRLITLKKLNPELLKGSQRMLGISAAEIRAAQNASRLKIAWTSLANGARSLGLAMKSLLFSPWTIALGIITAIGELFTYWKNESDKLKEITKGIQESAVGSVETIQKELDKLKSVEIGKLNDSAVKIQIENLAELIKNEAPYWQGILAEVFAQDASGNFVKTGREQLEMLIQKIKDVQKAKQMMLDNPEVFSNALEGTDGWADEPLTDNLKDYEEAIRKNEKQLDELRNHYKYVQNAIDLAAGSNKKFLEESEGKSIQQKIILLRKYSNEFTVFTEKLQETNKKASSIVSKYIEGLSDIWNGDDWGNVRGDINYFQQDIWKELLSMGYTKSSFLDESARQVVIFFGQKLIQEAKVQDPKVIEHFWREYLKHFNNLKDTDFSAVPEGSYKTTPEVSYDPSKDEVAKLWKKRAEEIDKAVAAYDKWKKVEGAGKAEQRIKGMDEFENLFNGKYGFSLSLENPTAVYEYIQSKLNKNLSAQKELIVSLGVKLSEAELKDAQDKLKSSIEQLKKDTKKIVEGWNLYEDLFKATGNKDVSMKIAFGGNVGFKNVINHLESQIKDKMKSLGIGISFEDLVKIDSISLEEAGFSGLTDLIDTYNKENSKLKEESVKNFLEIIKNSKDFAQQIADIDRKLQKDLSDLANGYGDTNSTDYKKRSAELIKKAEEDKVKVEFEEFKESSDWVKVFDDLDRVSDATLDNMISKIEEFAKQAHLSEEVTKQLVEAMAKLRDEAIERNPFAGFKDAWNRLKYLKSGVLTESGMVRFGSGTQQDPYTFKNNKDVNNEISEANDDLKDSALAVADKFQAVANAADLLGGLFENLGIDLGGLKDVFGGAASGAQTGAGIASAFGLAGPWGAIAGAAVGMLSSVFAMHDKSLQKEIEASEARVKAIKNIAEHLESILERTMGGVYSIALNNKERNKLNEIVNKLDSRNLRSYLDGNKFYSDKTRKKAQDAIRENSYYDAQLALLMAEREEVQEQMRLEDEKKKTNKDKIEDYKKELDELDMSIKYFAEDMANALYGIDFKDWASQLSEALVNAWANGEDAVLAYRDTVTSILKDLGVSILTQKVIEPLLNETMDKFIKQFSVDNGKITDASMDILKEMYEGAEYAAEMTEAYLEGLKKMGIDVSEESKGDNTLSKGIQSVTEDTANLLGSYLNSIRHEVSVKRSIIEKLAGEDIPKMSLIAQAQLTQLNNIASNTLRNAEAADRIYDLFNRVVDKGGNKLKI